MMLPHASPTPDDMTVAGARKPGPGGILRWTLAAVAVLIAISSAPASGAREVTIPTDEDTYVDAANPSAPFGTSQLLKIQEPGPSGATESRALLEFPKVPADARVVVLRVFATAASPGPVLVRENERGCRWDYLKVTWTSRPPVGKVLATRPAVAAGWNDFRLPAASVPAAGGSACFYVTKAGGGPVTLESLSAAHPAQLVVATGAPTAAPTPPRQARPKQSRPHPAPGGTVARNAIVMSPSGSDRNPCTTSSPCRTLRRASSLLSPGRTLYARGGTYRADDGNESDDWKAPSGTANAPVTFRNYPGETPVFDGGATGCATACADDGSGEFLIPQGSYQVFRGLTVQHFNNQWGNGAITPIGSGAHHLTIEYMTFRDNGHDESDHDIYTGAGPVRDLTIRHNRFIGGTGAGVHMYHPPNTRGALIADNVFREKFWGVIVCDGATDIRIVRNTFFRTSTPDRFNPRSASVQTSCGSVPAGTVTVRDNVSHSVAAGLDKGSGVTVHDAHNVWSGP
jgi:hypothetical protein